MDEGEDIDSYGFVNVYDCFYDKLLVKNLECKFFVFDCVVYNVMIFVDFIIQEFVDKEEVIIFVIDSIFLMLMCVFCFVYFWDIVIVRQGNKVFFDKCDNVVFDMVIVNENVVDVLFEVFEGFKDFINQFIVFVEEVIYINYNFVNQVVFEQYKVSMVYENFFYFFEEFVFFVFKVYKYRWFDFFIIEESFIYFIVCIELDVV